MTLVDRVTYSSYLLEQNLARFAYHPINLFDENTQTAWLEGAQGDGIGEWVELSLFAPIDLSAIVVSNGHGKPAGQFENNGRVSKLRVTVGTNITREFELKDRPEPQALKLKADGVKWIRLKIAGAHKGTVNRHAGITELSLQCKLSGHAARQLKDEDVDGLIQMLMNYDNDEATLKKLKERLPLLSAEQLREMLSRNYPSLPGAGNDERFGCFLTSVTKNVSLIPVFLSLTYSKRSTLLQSESSDYDNYADIARVVWKGHAESVPFLSHGGERFYSTYYSILSTGDTRIVPKYLDAVRDEGIGHEFCCELMPHQILTRFLDEYTRN